MTHPTVRPIAFEQSISKFKKTGGTFNNNHGIYKKWVCSAQFNNLFSVCMEPGLRLTEKVN